MDSSSGSAPDSADPVASFGTLRAQLRTRIIGQEALIDRLIIALLSDGHLLVEGAPGLAKTTAIKELAERIEGDFHRVQFTPDLLPADLTGTEVYRPQDGSFQFQKGPIFHNLLLADEINRAPAKVQSALLEAMGERQVTVGSQTYALPDLFMVMATQNPIEQEGTYPLPEAQLDRFLMYVCIDYPAAEAEHAILQLNRETAAREASQPTTAAAPMLNADAVFRARRDCLSLHLAPAVERYIVELVLATRDAARYREELGRWVSYGASPRATIALDRCSRAHAWINHRDYVSPEDVQAIAHDVLRHRVLISFEAEADGMDADAVISELLKLVPVP
ncbi:MAG: AAA domain-containing protein [Gammaproteobacteria bacterium]|jgi:MoxR-like ATPase|nr:AAA domain-containing protein [Gammaproteobacteria bacterium]NCF81181.1 AAA domain-containing protein [Pseudomonadota bacterium]